MRQYARHHIANTHGCSYILKEGQAHKQEREAEDEFPKAFPVTFSTENQWHTDGQQRNREGCNIHFETYSRDNPRRHRRTDVGTHDDTDTLAKRHQSGIHKTHHHHRRCTRRLDECRNQDTCQDTHYAVLGHCRQNTTQAIARKLFKTLRHRLHSEEEQCQRTHERENVDNQFHFFVFLMMRQR